MIVYNSLSRKKEIFKPVTPGYIGMYVCGPTVYSDVHLGNCRTFISFDIIYRYLMHLGYKVRYVRNITDAGHLEGDRDEGDDKFSKKARLEKLEPMEIVQKYTLGFHKTMELFNALPPTIEPTATGHIIEQIEMVKKILKNNYAYEVDGTVYFDVEKYNKEKPYGILTNRKLEDMLEGTRELGGQDEKKGRLDFALWIKAKPEHLMQWPSPWGMGFPGWHIECSAMSEKYLGKQFDIHGGGMDLAATHHTNEIAQSQACYHISPVNYWLHTNMLTVNGARMSKSAGNGFLPHQLFTGDHPMLERAYSPMTVRFFMLQTHYRSTLDFSNEALQAAEKGFRRLWDAYQVLTAFNTGTDDASGKDASSSVASGNDPSGNDASGIDPSGIDPSRNDPSGNDAPGFNAEQDEKVNRLLNEMDEFMNDDFHTSRVLANMFDLVHVINGIKDKHIPQGTFSTDTIRKFQVYFKAYLEDIFGLKDESGKNGGKISGVVELLIEIRKEAKLKKDYATSDKIRNQLTGLGIILKDEKDGSISYSFG